MEVLADELGCKVGCLPSTYLGLPLGAHFKSVAAWDGVEERFMKRLGMWKRPVYFERWESYFDKKHVDKHTNLLLFFISDAKNNEIKS